MTLTPVRTAVTAPTTAVRGLLLTAAGPSLHAVLHDLSLPTFQRYADRWGYAVRAVDLPADGSRADPAAQRAKWTKVDLLRQSLLDAPVVVWLDADVLLLRDDEDVTSHLRSTDFQALAMEHVPAEHRVNPNTGVWVLRRCAESLRFLDAVEAVGQQPGPWADQGAVLAALGWDRGDDSYRWARPGAGSPFLARTAWLPSGWNQPHVTGRRTEESYNGCVDSYADRPVVPRPHALHFMGMTPAARYRQMSETLGGRVDTAADRRGRLGLLLEA